MFGFKLIKQSEYDSLISKDSNTVSNTVTTVITRLEPDVYNELEKKVSNILVSSTTTELEAGYKLGIQHVLKVLRDGYAIQRG